ncbi:MAG TPA: Ppx/GppA phosphatase family protein [Acidimicrobiales bacterium]|nr:Ppx/GppA phosphatase family protein [Acidimicrobiales bacterium]
MRRTPLPSDLPVAAVDCGTNSTRLLIAGADGTAIDRRMRITRLGEGVDLSGRLQPAAIRRTLDVLAEYREATSARGVQQSRAVATSAIRDAANARAFLEPAAAAIGTGLTVLTGVEEGRLSYRGATSELPESEGPYLVVDVGGGSTELVTGRRDGSVEALSLDVGCVRVTERFLLADPPTKGQLTEARTYVAGLMEYARGGHQALRRAKTLVGLAGTVSALAMLSLRLESYDRAAVHHARLRRAEVARLLGELCAETVEKRRERVGMEHDRADVIIGGAVVLMAVLDVFGFDELIVSESDILDGIVGELLGSRR